MELTRQDFINIFRQIVIAYPYDPCKQINTFVVADSIADFETANLNKTYLDFQTGSFWSRKWVLQGADPNKLCKQYPILALENKVSTKKDIFSKTTCSTWWVSILDVPDCPDCKSECKRTWVQVDQDLVRMIDIVIAEFSKFNLYTITVNGEEQSAWATQEQIDYWVTEGQIESYQVECTGAEVVIEPEAVEIRSTDIGATDKARAVALSIKFCECIEEELVFNYITVSPKQVSRTKCTIC